MLAKSAKLNDKSNEKSTKRRNRAEMTSADIINEIKLELTGGVLELELSDETLNDIINRALREVQRYWDETTLVTVPYASCIDLKGTPIDGCVVTNIYRTTGLGNANEPDGGNVLTMDPMFAQQWMIFSNAGTMYSLQDYMLNYGAWSTLTQIQNTMSTDMAFKQDRQGNKLYINDNISAPGWVTIEYIPRLAKPEDVKSDYWRDILERMSIALTKIALGRIRTRFTQSGALWSQDGDTMLNEGTTEFKELRDLLRSNSQMIYPLN